MRLIFYFLLLLAILIGVAFACLNAQPIIINYFVGKHTFPLSLILALTLVLGSFLGFLGGLGIYIRQSRTNYRLRKRIKIAEQEISNLRVMPLKDSH